MYVNKDLGFWHECYNLSKVVLSACCLTKAMKDVTAYQRSAEVLLKRITSNTALTGKICTQLIFVAKDQMAKCWYGLLLCWTICGVHKDGASQERQRWSLIF